MATRAVLTLFVLVLLVGCGATELPQSVFADERQRLPATVIATLPFLGR